MQSFVWDQRFETGLVKVDEQHRHLVEVLNKFGEWVVDGTPGGESRATETLEELARYAEYHFSTEHALMDKAGLDWRHTSSHIAEHASFMRDVGRIAASAQDAPQQRWQVLLEFLTHWLIFHILGTDQVMAHQIRAMEAGLSAGQAFDAHARMADGATATLLNSLNALFKLVSERNRDLFELNETLERSRSAIRVLDAT